MKKALALILLLSGCVSVRQYKRDTESLNESIKQQNNNNEAFVHFVKESGEAYKLMSDTLLLSIENQEALEKRVADLEMKKVK